MDQREELDRLMTGADLLSPTVYSVGVPISNWLFSLKQPRDPDEPQGSEQRSMEEMTLASDRRANPPVRVEEFNGPSRIRTWDQSVMSRQL